MPYTSLRDCVDDLERTGQLRRVDVEVDAHLEAAEIQRRVFRARGPALYFARVKGCRFPMVSNLFGTMERARFIFRDSLDKVRRLIELERIRARPGSARCATQACPSLCCARGPGAWRAVRSSPARSRSASCRNFSAGPTTAAPSSRCPRCTARIQSGPGLPTATWACIASSFPAASTSRTARWACTTRSIAASACTTRLPSGAARSCV
jgi:hypothetical protein